MSVPYLIRVAFTADGPCTAEFRRHIETLVGRTVKAFKGMTVQSVECGPACPCCDQFDELCPCDLVVLDNGTWCPDHEREVST